MGSNILQTALETFINTGGVNAINRNIQQKTVAQQNQQQQQQILNVLNGLGGPTATPATSTPEIIDFSETGGLTIPDSLPADLGGSGPAVSQAPQPQAQQDEVQQALTLAELRERENAEERRQSLRIADAAIKLSFLGEQGAQTARLLLQKPEFFTQTKTVSALAEIKDITNSAMNTLILENEEAALEQIINAGNSGALSTEAKAILNNNIDKADPGESIKNLSAVLNQGQFAQIERQEALDLRQQREKGEIDQRRKETPQELTEQDRLKVEKTRLEVAKMQQQIDSSSRDSEKKKTKAKNQVNSVVSGIDNVIGRVDKAIEQAQVPTATGLPGAITAGIPTTPSFNLEKTVETIKANIGFDKLQKMRDLSPTGGALGQVAIQELNALQNSIANLDQTQDQEIVLENLNLVRDSYENWKLTLQGINPREGTEENPLLSQAREAISKGADRGAVIRRLQQMGASTEGL